MTPRLITIGIMSLLLASACTSGGTSEDGAKPKKDAIEAFELRSTDPGSISCGETGPQMALLYRSRDGSFGWMDDGADGTVDGISAGSEVYLPDPAPDTGSTPSRWIRVPASRSDPLGFFAYFLNLGPRSVGIFDTADDPMHELQTRQENGEKSPAPIFEDDPRGGTATWKTDDDGRVVEATLELPPEADNIVQTIRLLPSTEVPERPAVPTNAVDLADEPLADYLPRSVMIDPACGETTEAAFAAAQPCLDAAMAGQTVGDWVRAHDKQGSLRIPPECT